MLGFRQDMSQNRSGLGDTAQECVGIPRWIDNGLVDFDHTAKRRGPFGIWTSLQVLADASIGCGMRLAIDRNPSRPGKTEHGWRA